MLCKWHIVQTIWDCVRVSRVRSQADICQSACITTQCQLNTIGWPPPPWLTSKYGMQNKQQSTVRHGYQMTRAFWFCWINDRLLHNKRQVVVHKLSQRNRGYAIGLPALLVIPYHQTLHLWVEYQPFVKCWPDFIYQNNRYECEYVTSVIGPSLWAAGWHEEMAAG